MKFKPDRNLALRLMTGFVIGPVVLLGIYTGGLALLGLIGLAGLLATTEFYEMMHRQHIRAPLLIGLLAAAALIGAGYIGSLPLYAAVFVLLTVISLALSQSVRSAGPGALLMIGAAAYIAVPLSLCLTIRESASGMMWAFTVIFANWGTDSFAYICGRLFGRHKLAPNLSPNKTIEGAVGGGVLGAAMGIAFNVLFYSVTPSVVIISILVAISTIVGDLLESAIKRRFGAKDAGNILPGHGGVLDRIDGLMVSCVVVWLYLLVLNVATASM